MQYLDLAEEPPHRADALFKTDLGRRGPRYHHNVGVVVYLRAVRPVKLPQKPLDAVADYGRANLSRYGKSKLATLTFPPDRVTHEQRPHAPAACSKGRLEIPFAREALMPWKRQWARHNSSASSRYADRLFRPLARRRLMTFCPVDVAMRFKKPWFLFRFNFDG